MVQNRTSLTIKESRPSTSSYGARCSTRTQRPHYVRQSNSVFRCLSVLSVFLGRYFCLFVFLFIMIFGLFVWFFVSICLFLFFFVSLLGLVSLFIYGSSTAFFRSLSPSSSSSSLPFCFPPPCTILKMALHYRIHKSFKKQLDPSVSIFPNYPIFIVSLTVILSFTLSASLSPSLSCLSLSPRLRFLHATGLGARSLTHRVNGGKSALRIDATDIVLLLEFVACVAAMLLVSLSWGGRVGVGWGWGEGVG